MSQPWPFGPSSSARIGPGSSLQSCQSLGSMRFIPCGLDGIAPAGLVWGQQYFRTHQRGDAGVSTMLLS